MKSLVLMVITFLLLAGVFVWLGVQLHKAGPMTIEYDPDWTRDD